MRVHPVRYSERRHSNSLHAALFVAVAALALLVVASVDHRAALAQVLQQGGILANGNAVVTGFSGAQAPAAIAPGEDPADKTFIDVEGPSARVIDLQALGGLPQAQLVAAPKPFTVTSGQVGQVFGVALDNAPQPNVFVAASSAYGLPIVVPGAGGQLVRAKQGAPNAVFMPGLFGPAQIGGGPGSIWRIDGVTGEVRLFANVTFDGAPNPGAALGGLAFDAATGTLFVADRATGMIHAFDASGNERGRYDHGVAGRSALGLQPVAYDPAGRLDISSAKFRPGNPATWGYANPQRLIFGLAVRNGRLYYALAKDLQIWSVAIAPQFGADPRLELTVPAGPGPSEIAKIAFDGDGRMLLAERAAPSGAPDFAALTVEATGRVLRYLPIQPNTQGAQWQQEPDEYAIGFARQMRNGNGGVAIGFGYDEQGRIDRAACGQFLWSTGEQLRNPIDPALAALLAQGGPAEVNGLQGNPVNAVVPANAPPFVSYFIDYDDKFQDTAARGHLGDVAIPRVCEQAGLTLPGWYRPRAQLLPGFFWFFIYGHKPPLLDCPPGSGNQCACPPGTWQQPGFLCCPLGFTPGPNGQCKSPCPNGSTDPEKVTICLEGFDPNSVDPTDWSKLTCLDGSKPVTDGQSYHCPTAKWSPCPVGFEPDPNSPVGCKPTPAFEACNGGGNIGPTKQIGLDGSCQILCPKDQWAFAANQCCPQGMLPGPDGKCGKQPCPPQQMSSKGICCPAGSKPQPDGGCLLKVQQQCPPEQLTASGQCCPSGTKPQPNGTCEPPLKTGCPSEQQTPNGTCCPIGTKPQADNSCAPQTGCPSGTTLDAATGQCCAPSSAVAGAAAACSCPSGKTLVDGKCVPAAAPTQGGCFAGYVQLPNGSCCQAGQVTSGGQCCPPGQKPDADKRKCVPAAGSTFVPLAPVTPAPVVIPRGKHRGKAVVTPPPHPAVVVPPPPKRFVPPPPPKRFAPPPKRVAPKPLPRPTTAPPRVLRQIEQ